MSVFIFKKRLEHRLKIEQQIPVLHIIQIITNAFGQICIATKTVDLRPAGDAGLDRVASLVVWYFVLEIPN